MAAETIRLTRPEFGRTAFSRARRTAGPSEAQHGPLPMGLLVRVRNRFEDRWVPGFSVAGHEAGRYQLRRCSDGCILPAWFPGESVRPDED
jgi:hypothetical protein